MICFDRDGTIADLYGVKGWLEMLRNENPTPYEVAEPIWNTEALNATLMALQAKGIEIRIVTWLSKDSTEEYKTATREAKKDWLADNAFPYDHFHGVKYGATKADSIRKYLAEGETAILIDDNDKVRRGWHMGEAINPTTTNIIEYLVGLL
jgi:hypothetical protein